MQHRIAGSFRRAPAFLAGDAAHVHSPAGGRTWGSRTPPTSARSSRLSCACPVLATSTVTNAADAPSRRRP
ncbi:MAG TPA: FAD-dependent monooxygenase [Trebonia sp.]